MEVINNKEDLIKVVENSSGCVVYGAGLVGTCLIQYLAREKMLSQIICVAVKSREKNPAAVMGIPVCEIKELESYKDNYLFIIATLEHLQEEISDELNILNYKHFCGISNLFYAEIRAMMNDFTPDILCKLDRGLNCLYESFFVLNKKVEEAIYKIEEQNEISVTNTKAFAEYQNCYRGRDIVIVATGPSLNDYKPIKDAIHIGVNTAYKYPDLHLDFLFTQDGRPYHLKEKYKGLKELNCKIFMGRVLNSFTFGQTIEFPEEYRLRENVSDYILDHVGPTPQIYRDICNHPVSGWITVTFSALHFALYTYPKRIYLVGCDVSSEGYFDGTVDNETIIKDATAESHIKGYHMMKDFARIHYPETEIISINPVGLKGIFKDIYTR